MIIEEGKVTLLDPSCVEVKEVLEVGDMQQVKARPPSEAGEDDNQEKQRGEQTTTDNPVSLFAAAKAEVKKSPFEELKELKEAKIKAGE